MSKFKWIAQDRDGKIYKYTNESEPGCMELVFATDGRDMKLVRTGKPNPNFANTLINLETEDYKINDGILTRITRKTELDKLITKVKKIDKKAAKWMNNNRYKLEDINYLSFCFDWDICEKYDWINIHNELIKLETEPAKETLKYKVGLYYFDNEKYLSFATNQEHESLAQRNPDFVRWLTDWIEVKV